MERSHQDIPVLQPNQQPSRTKVHPIVALGVALLLAGLLGWIWLGNWRLAATGGLLLLAAAFAAGALSNRKKADAAER